VLVVPALVGVIKQSPPKGIDNCWGGGYWANGEKQCLCHSLSPDFLLEEHLPLEALLGRRVTQKL
jgi:hypothetical protein